MANVIAIHTFLNQPGWTILVWLVTGWILSTSGIFFASRRLATCGADSAGDSLNQLKTGVISAWPVYWLAVYFCFFDRNLAWQALLVMIPTLLVLPSAWAGFLRGSVQYPLSIVSGGFLVFVMLIFCGAGIGMDREFDRLEGHMVLTMLLLYLWWDWRGRKAVSDAPAKVAACVPVGKMVVPVLVYHVGAIILLLGVRMLAAQMGVAGGMTFGLLLALAWSPSLARDLMANERGCGFLITLLPLVILFLAGVLVLACGGVEYPITLWQMEACSGLVVAILWLGLGVINQPLGRLENVLLLVLYAVYLGLRVFRLF